MDFSRRTFCFCLSCALGTPATAPAARNRDERRRANATDGSGGSLVEPSLFVPKGGQAPTVALTFDACSGDVDHRILDTLIRENLPATIFVTGRWLRRNSEALALMQSRRDLFQIENHGLNHVPAIDWPARVYGIPAAGSMDAVISEVEDGATGMERLGLSRPGWFRGATARYSESALSAISARGYRIAGYSLNGDLGASTSTSGAAARVGAARDGDVVLAHINHPERPSGAGVAEGILSLKRRRFSFVRLDSLPKTASAIAGKRTGTP